MEHLYMNQQEIAEAINKFITNIQKAGIDRRTEDYFKRRLEIVEGYWREFESNHRSIYGLGVEDHPYFTDKMYEQTKAVYLSTLELINKQRREQTVAESRPSSVPTAGRKQELVLEEASQVEISKVRETETSTSRQKVSRGSMSKLDELVRKQSVNFKAFMRTANSIQIERISETWEFEDMLKELQCRWTAIDTLHWEIYMESNGEDDEYEGQFTRHETIFNDLKKAVNKKLWSVSHREKSVPKIEIPIFSGNYQQWTSFKDLFNEAVHNNPSLSLAQKMQFLKGKLRGEPERLIQHPHISSDNYKACWEILTNRYNNKKLIFTTHINTLLGLPNVTQQSSAQIKRMHDVTLETLHAIENLEVDVSTWDPFLVHILAQKLDNDTYSDYLETLKNPRDLPVLKDFLSYLESKFTSLESARRKQDQVSVKQAHSNQNKSHVFVKKPYNHAYNYSHNKTINKSFPVTSIICPLCSEEHSLFHCKNFNSLPSDIKLKKAKELKLCLNCLFDHNGKQCISTKRCRKCNAKHNSLIHDACVKVNMTPHAQETFAQSREHVGNNLHVSPGSSTEILLATALIKVTAGDGSCHILRALVDQGSQISLITENAAQRLGVKRTFCRGVVYGLGQKANNSKGMISITCTSIYNDFTFRTDVLIMNSLMKRLPNTTFDKPSWSFIRNVNLADPEFYVSRPVDLLLGSDIYALIKMGGISRGDKPYQPLAEQTQLGWILFGRMQSYHCNVVLNNIDNIQQFWEVEDIEEQSSLSAEEQGCIDFYLNTTERRQEGRYVVKLPIKQDVQNKLGTSKGMAVAQFRSLENKFEKQADLAKQYKAFIDEYLQLNHMIPSKMIQSNNSSNSEQKLSCFLPHHAVQRAESTTTKLRVVFNASAKTSTGYSLNDIMYKGPNLQKDLQSLIIKWRQYRYAFTADIEKMYRQITVHEHDQQYQQIVWRETKKQPIKSYQLTTVTYGTKAAPFLAMMTLKQLAADESRKYPEAAKVIEESMYMDDLVHSCHELESGKQLIADIDQVLRLGGFTLRKWVTNEPKILERIENKTSEQKHIFHFKAESTSKTLGIRWNSQLDMFNFQCNFDDKQINYTKRKILSEISKLFDPLGWLAPITTKLKLLFQRVWLANLQWDDIIPADINTEWIKIKTNMTHLKQCEIPRWIEFQQGDIIELHGFCDASLKAYAGVIYARIIRNNDIVAVSLIGSKTRLVPGSKQISLPRLEMCGAQLLSTNKWMTKVVQCLDKQHKIEVYGWTDSMVVLGWLQGEPGRWKTFVANRVRSITKIIEPRRWRYVKSAENPADAASRGLLASQLANNTLWWQGPEWIKSFKTESSKEEQAIYTTYEERVNSAVNFIQKSSEENIIFLLLNKHSSIIKIIRIIAWILRAIRSIRWNKNICKQNQTYLTLRELKQAKVLIIKYIQRCEFAEDIEYYKKYNSWSNKSRLLKLNPFLDTQGILRVGGRLKNAQLNSNMKFPIVIPYSGILTKLLIEQAHQLIYHGGPRLTLANLRQKYWIISGNRAVKQELRKCVTCRKHDPKQQYQLMGDLPAERVNPASPFYHTGVDYTGYVEVKASKGRGIKTCKGYIALFICMVTKAVHLELVSDLSSTVFLAALRRMSARRGAPRHIYSDNGTNFVGANRVLQAEFYDLRNRLDDRFYKEIAELNIEWHFNAPSWPSAGGLWERAIRSLKHHLKRVIGEQKLTFEEFSTMLAQLETCLNSRPLCPLAEDVEDLDFLTPAHFLTGRAGSTVIETEQDARSRWYLADKLAKDIWKRFKIEYLTQLAVRNKWNKQQDNMKVGDLVTIQDENLPPGKWMMGRVIELHPGSDGLVRVVSLKTKGGILMRPIVKLSTLPIAESTEDVTKQKEQKEENINTEKRTLFPSNLYSMAVFFILFMSLISNSLASYNITQLKNSQGLYFDKIANMKLVRDQWKLIAYYDMSPYWEGVNAYNKLINHLNSTCVTSGNNDCNMIVLQLRHEYNELQYHNNLLLTEQFSGQSPHARRRRRGLINGVGYIANSLFGVLDERFAEQYSKDIALVRRNQVHLADLWRKQTSIVEAQSNLLQRTTEIMLTHHKYINKQLMSIKQMNSVLQSEINNIMVMQDFTLSSLSASNLVQNLKATQDNLIDALTDIYHGQFQLHLLTPEQLLHELNIIAGQVSEEVSLPINNVQNDVRKIYKLIKVKARMTKNYLLFEIMFPLVCRDNFKLYKTIPVPQQINRNMVTVVPISNYIAVNIGEDTYLSMSHEELAMCTINDENYMCPQQKPVFHLNNNPQFCKIDFETNKCAVQRAVCQNKWESLYTPTQFLYFCCDEYTVSIVCGEDLKILELSKGGVISIAPNCNLKGKDFTLAPHKIYQNQLNISSDLFIPKIDHVNHLINITPAAEEVNNTDSKELSSMVEQLKQQIKDMRASRTNINYELTPHDIHQYTGISLLLAGALVVGGVFLWKKGYCRRRTERVITPDIELQSISSNNVRRTSIKRNRRWQPEDGRNEEKPKATLSHSKINKACSPISFERRDVRC